MTRLTHRLSPCLLLVLSAWPAPGAPKPVPSFQAIPLPHHQISFQRDGHELTRYHFAPDLHRPFLFPINGPSGRSLTRMGHPRDPESHSHHNSFWVSHHDVDGLRFWDDRGQGRIRHRRVLRFDDGNSACAAEVANEWVGTNGVVLDETRRITVQAVGAHDWLLVLDLTLEPRRDPVTLGKTPFGLVGVRMAKTLGVHDGGGTIRNSEGGIDEEGVFWKPARWVDYSGLIAPDRLEGLTLLDHSDNPRHPAVFHVRNDGWMGASLTFSNSMDLRKGAPLKVRYGLFVHEGAPPPDLLEATWKSFNHAPQPEP